MGGETSLLSKADARHLLRRSGFGAPRDEVQEMLDRGETRAAAADRLLAFSPKAFKPGGNDFATVHNKWIKYMIKTRFPLQEKLVLFWHDHFATGISKLTGANGNRAGKIMAAQIQLFHRHCRGDMKALVKAINVNGAMMEYLDTPRNFQTMPNENYARELQELFTLGVLDSAGNPNYLQTDIVQIARGFTGWTYDNNGNPLLREYLHDFLGAHPERGPKQIFGSSTAFGTLGQFNGPQSYAANGEGRAELDTIIDIIFAHRDTDFENTVARRTARRLCEYFAHPNPSQTFVDAVVADSGFDVTFDLTALVRAIFVHDDFYLSGAPVPWGSAVKTSVKWPVDYVVSTLRLLGMQLKGTAQFVDGGSFGTAITHLADMGQVLLEPPSVFGWNWETNWLSSTTLLARFAYAVDVTSARGGGKSGLHADKFFDLGLTDPSAIVEEAAAILGIEDHLSAAEQAIMADYLTDNGLNPTLDLTDDDTRNVKLHGLFGLLLQSPAYHLH